MPKTDVLIAGSGSAGIFAATWLALYNIPFVMLERRAGPLEIGQADGVQVRTVEIYESFGLAEDLLREAYHILEVCFWGVDDGEQGIKRKSRSIDTEKGLTSSNTRVVRARLNMAGRPQICKLTSTLVGDPNTYPCRVTASKDGQEVTWESKYVLGCDGAHSTIRRSLGLEMLGDTDRHRVGVMDIYPLTSFPDIRRKCTIHSSSGNLLIIPREGGQLVRFYIQLPAGTHPKQVTLEDLQSTARSIFKPYTMDFADVFWWSAYSIGQRLASQFHAHHRVFLTGDAAHTHSPKAGQGMNVSLQDGYNIGWKLGSVLRGLCPKSILETYVSERSKTAADLIAFDRELSKMFSRKEEREGEFAEYFTKSGRYMAGFTARYEDSEITDGREQTNPAKSVTVGMRFPSAQVIRFCDCKAVQLQSVLKSDGTWRVVIFAGDINVREHKTRLHNLATSLEATSRHFTPSTQHMDSVIEPILVLNSKFLETEQVTIPDYFWPISGKWNIRDLHKTYIDDEHYNSGHGHAYEKYGVDPSVGAVVIVRPDQYVSKVTMLDDHEGIAKFFEGCLIRQTR